MEMSHGALAKHIAGQSQCWHGLTWPCVQPGLAPCEAGAGRPLDQPWAQLQNLPYRALGRPGPVEPRVALTAAEVVRGLGMVLGSRDKGDMWVGGWFGGCQLYGLGSAMCLSASP